MENNMPNEINRTLPPVSTMKDLHPVDLWKWGSISSGETTLLDEEQAQFNAWLNDDDAFWNYELYFNDDISFQNRFFTYLGDHIRSVPSYTYILRIMLHRYGLGLNSRERRGLYAYIDEKKWRNSSPDHLTKLFEQLHKRLEAAAESPEPVLTQKDYNAIICAISAALKTEYPEELVKKRLGKRGKWSTYFNSILSDFTIRKLRDIALALDWEWKDYAIVKKKALRLREINYLDREDVLMYLTLQYAPVCGLRCYPAYCILEKLYPEYAKGMRQDKARACLDPDDPDSSVRIGALLKEKLETTDGILSPHYRNTLFVEADDALFQIIRKLQILRAAKVSRSVMDVIKKEWSVLTPKLLNNENIDAKSTSQKRHELFRFLYGDNVEKKIYTSTRRGIKDISEDQLVSIAPYCTNRMDDSADKYFLDSKEFHATRLRDSYFEEANFTVDESTQRNILLTVLFLNYLTAFDHCSSYEERVDSFDDASVELLEECGFVSLYSGFAYDAFLKLLLSCEDPKGLFEFIWHVKTGSYLPGKSPDAI